MEDSVFNRLSVVLCIAATGCGADSPLELDAPQTPDGTLIGGTTEYGYPGVGALTFEYAGYGYVGSFCSATLIDPFWVLTASHCLNPNDNFSPTADGTYFFVGTEAEPLADGSPPPGEYYPAAEFITHPSWTGTNDTGDDIALVRLATPASSVTPYDYNTVDLDSSFLYSVSATSPFYVGFGATNGADGTGSGTKRSAYIPIEQIQPMHYVSTNTVPSVCFGDSGGPGLWNFGGDLRVIGVNSSVAGYDPDPCQDGVANQTRVDVHASWIANEMSIAAPDCNIDSTQCLCPAACQVAGWCDNSACQTMACEGVYACSQDCSDATCANTCYSKGSTTAKQQFNDLTLCMSDCAASATTNAQYSQCVDSNCSNETTACFGVGTMTCLEAWDCAYECPSNGCASVCYWQATPIGHQRLAAMYTCFADECDGLSGEPYSDCAFSNCAAEMDTCWQVTNCELLGGECPSGEACYPVGTGSTICFPSNDRAIGQSCNAAGVDCADGLACNASQCVPYCTSAADCPGAGGCELGGIRNMPNFGMCGTCTDLDQDGYCPPDDCDDIRDIVSPGLPEACGDGLDNNCDGAIDEDCPYVSSGSRGRSSYTEEEGCSSTGGSHAAMAAWALLVLIYWRRRPA